jgi:uncharacterized repeat protein (TIGR01451 family)
MLLFFLLTAVVIPPAVAVVNAAPFFAPAFLATKVDTLINDGPGGVTPDDDGDNQADPGETIEYTIAITNTGPDPATGVVYTDTIDANTTLVGGSVTASPVAVNDTFPVTVVGNVSINSAALASPFSATANDFLGLNPTATISSFQANTLNGGQVVMTTSGAGMGQFTYDPPAGFEGTDTFTYTLTDNANANSPAANRTATVSITVSGMVWFINNTAPACTINGCGRLSNPFSTLAAFNTLNDGVGNHPANNDNIFIYESGTGYSGAVTLRTGQKLIGQDATASLSTITGLTPPTGSPSFPAMNSGNGTVTNLVSTVTLTTNVTARGFSINSTTSTGMNDPAGAITGVSVSEVNVTTTTGTGVNFSDTAGSFSFTGLTTSGGTGANLTGSNAGATFTFMGVAVSSGANTGFNATGGGTVNVCDENPCNPAATGALVNTLTSTTGTALNVANTTIGANNLEFRSISANGATNGVVLNTTGSSGGLSVKGTGSAGSGGTIQNITNRGASFINANNISLAYMNFTNANGTDGALSDGVVGGNENTDENGAIHLQGVTQVDFTNLNINGAVQHGVNGNDVTDLDISNTTIQNAGDEVWESSIYIFDLKGVASANRTSIFNNLNITNDSGQFNVAIFNDNGTNDRPAEKDRLEITNSQFTRNGNNDLISDNVTIFNSGTGNFQVIVTGSTFASTVTWFADLHRSLRLRQHPG